MHVPVLVREVGEGLHLTSGSAVIDATCGFGGHGEAILQATAPDGRYLGIEADPAAAEMAQKRLRVFGERAQVVQGNYRDMRDLARQNGFSSVQGVLFDLGFSSWQVDKSGRGFSFLKDEPLDMRFDPTSGATCAEFLQQVPESDLRQALREYGDEEQAGRVARAICEARDAQPLRTTSDLVNVVEAVKGSRRVRGLHPATKIFQALRIAVNHEFDNIEAGLAAAVDVLSPRGRLVVISFHSGEDRLVKNYLRREEKGCICPPDFPVCRCGHVSRLRVLTRKPIHASEEEIEKNSRSRSAILRIAEKI